MTNKEKLEKLKEFLKENRIKFRTSGNWPGVDLRIQKYNINVHVTDNTDAEFYKRMVALFPVFIRDEDSADFVIEKVQNTIVKSLHISHNRFMKSQKKLKAEEAKKLQSETQNQCAK